MFLTLAETALRLRLSVRTVRRLTAAGAIPIVRLSPRRVAVPLVALERYEAHGWQSANSPTVDGCQSFKQAAREYTAACLNGPRKRTPKPSKPVSGANSGNVLHLVERMNRR